MKKAFFTIMLMAFSLGLFAQQTITYRQDLQQELQSFVVSGSCIIKLLSAPENNYIQYKSTVPPALTQSDLESMSDDLVSTMVTIEGNKLTTTAAANGKTITVGTTAKTLEFDVRGDAMILYKDKVYSSCKAMVTEGDNVEEGEMKPQRTWQGLTKYDFAQRFHDDFFFGPSNMLGLSDGISNPLIDSKKSTSLSWQLSYDLYRDEQFAAGIGVQWIDTKTYKLKQPYVITEPHGLSAPALPEHYNEPSNWGTTINTVSFGMLLQFSYYPTKKSGSRMYLQLEIIPTITWGGSIINEYKKSVDGTDYTITERRDLPYNMFTCTGRLSANWGVVGVYVEHSITPVTNLKLDDKLSNLIYGTTGHSIRPSCFAVGIRINLLETLLN